MEEKDKIKELFQKGLQHHEVPVSPEMWAAVSSSIGVGAKVGMSLATKLLLGGLGAATISGAIILSVLNKKEDKPVLSKKEILKENAKETPQKQSTSPENSSSTQAKKPTSNNTNLVDNSFHPISYVELAVSTPTTNETVIETKPSHYEVIPVVKPENVSNNLVQPTKPSENKVVPVNETKVAPKESELKIVMPNVFTPNNDGNNDFLTLDAVEIADFSLVVLDASGKLVYRTSDNNFEWDGNMLNGDKAPAGNYVYFITGKDKQGKPVSKYSNLTIRY